ncbi:MAG: WD40 repeat domain-containing protein, partial [bacterium]
MARLASVVLLGVLAIAGCESSATRERAVRAAYDEYRSALASQDLTALRDILTAERVPELDAAGAEQTLALVASMSPTGAEVVGITVEGDGAEIALSGEMEGATLTGVARLRRESGAWKIDKEEWSIQVSAGVGVGGSGDFAARLRTGPEGAPSPALRLAAHEGAVTSVAFSPDGATLVTASFDDLTIRSWDLGNGSEIGAVRCERRPTDMAVARDGTVVVGDAYGNVTRYPLRAGELGEAQRVDGSAGGISRIAIDPEGAVIASTGWEDPVRLWDLRSRGNRSIVRSGGMRGIAFSP